ncbi:MAG: TIGR03663 family protein [Anaerolineales bacterium]|nr:TIGR03663 family protein [Anaerolineales bacterium]
MPKNPAPSPSWLDKPLLANFKLTWEVVLVAVLLLLAAVTRFHILGDRVMSHDETTHVLFSWNLFKGFGYSHDPLSHGPFQFHILALTYFLFGDTDFTARLPHALFGVATVLFTWWAFRRYLGRVGAMLAAFFMLISPYILYYSRYSRNEIFVALFGLVMLWGILRYLDRGENKYLYVITASLALHLASKETGFIYAAQALLFLGLLFLARLWATAWPKDRDKTTFFIVLLLGLSLLLLALGAQVSGNAAAPAVTAEGEPAPGSGLTMPAIILGVGGLLAVAVSLFLLVRGYGAQPLREERSFGLMTFLFALMLPHLGAFALKALAPDITYSTFRNMVAAINPATFFSSPDLPHLGLLFLVILVAFLFSASLGLFWNPRQWVINMAIFFAIFIPVFTTMFTNSLGFFTGLVGSLGYWIEQQAVQRGSQPAYYYWGLQIPVYEYLPALGTLLAAGIGLRLHLGRERPKPLHAVHRGRQAAQPALDPNRKLRPAESRQLALTLLAYWAASALAAYTIAGEKMPWLTVHITLPMILLSGWALGWVIRRVDWAQVFSPRGGWTLAALAVALLSGFAVLSQLLGAQPPFRGMGLIQLQHTTRFISTLLVLAGSLYALYRLLAGQPRQPGELRGQLTVLVFTALALLTARTAFQANYINYDLATEYLVYAHMAPGPKQMMEQLEDLSLRLTDSLDIQVAYDNESNYPLWWYLRNYPNKIYYDVNPSMSLRESPVIIVGDTNYGKVEPIVRQDYHQFQFVRIWWPNQDYFDFTRASVGFEFTSETGLPGTQMGTFDYLGRVARRLWNAVDSPEEREALWQVWLNRDFTRYLTLKGREASLSDWDPARSMRMYVRKDIAAQIWDYGVAPIALAPDPYADKGIALSADLVLGGSGAEVGLFNSPRGLAVAPNGDLYAADSLNHRIQRFSADGQLLGSWGGPSDPASMAGGTFAEPWGIAVSPDGRFVYVADTWNHRIQKFSATGEFITAWGTFGNSTDGMALYGPRDVAVAADGSVLVADTGNKRIVVYNSDGEYINQIGGPGFDLGQFEEPVGLALNVNTGELYVADTWNQRIQVLHYAGGALGATTSWEVNGWFGQSLNNKPYLAVDGEGRVYASDPEAGRVLVFDSQGALLHYFGGFDQGAVNIGVAQGLAVSQNGELWLSDSFSHNLLRFQLE